MIVSLDTPTMIANPRRKCAGRVRKRNPGEALTQYERAKRVRLWEENMPAWVKDRKSKGGSTVAKKKKKRVIVAGKKRKVVKKASPVKSMSSRSLSSGKRRKARTVYSMKRTKHGISFRKRKRKNPMGNLAPMLQSAAQIGGGAAAAIFIGAIGDKLLKKYAPTLTANQPTIAKAIPGLTAAAAGLLLAQLAKTDGLKQAGKACFAAGIVLAVNDMARDKIQDLASKVPGLSGIDGYQDLGAFSHTSDGWSGTGFGGAGYLTFDGLGGYEYAPDVGQTSGFSGGSLY